MHKGASAEEVQSVIVAFIADFRSRNDQESPTFEEISDYIGRCLAYTHQLVNDLCDKGKLRKRKHGARSLRIVKAGDK